MDYTITDCTGQGGWIDLTILHFIIYISLRAVINYKCNNLHIWLVKLCFIHHFIGIFNAEFIANHILSFLLKLNDQQIGLTTYQHMLASYSLPSPLLYRINEAGLPVMGYKLILFILVPDIQIPLCFVLYRKATTIDCNVGN